jgi:predicted heme/steroid binding protein
MKKSLIIILLLILLFSTPVLARSEYAQNTGQSCSTCHTDSTIGELNDVGKAFSVTHQWPPGEVSQGQNIFVSIVFVHTIYKASTLAMSGVPKNELKIGWISLFFIGISGIYLTLMRFNSIDELLNSYPGRLVLGKIILFSIMAIFASVVTLVINKKLKSSPSEPILNISTNKEIGLEELKKYDGSESKACVAYAGVIFDVTDSNLWKEGLHMRKHNAGEDLTMAFMEAPHGPDVLDRFEAVAKVTGEGRSSQTSRTVKIFKTLAVINFISAILAVLLSALLAWPL